MKVTIIFDTEVADDANPDEVAQALFDAILSLLDVVDPADTGDPLTKIRVVFGYDYTIERAS